MNGCSFSALINHPTIHTRRKWDTSKKGGDLRGSVCVCVGELRGPWGLSDGNVQLAGRLLPDPWAQGQKPGPPNQPATDQHAHIQYTHTATHKRTHPHKHTQYLHMFTMSVCMYVCFQREGEGACTLPCVCNWSFNLADIIIPDACLTNWLTSRGAEGLSNYLIWIH